MAGVRVNNRFIEPARGKVVGEELFCNAYIMHWTGMRAIGGVRGEHQPSCEPIRRRIKRILGKREGYFLPGRYFGVLSIISAVRLDEYQIIRRQMGFDEVRRELQVLGA